MSDLLLPSVRCGSGNHLSRTATLYPTPYDNVEPKGLALGDLNGDGRTDIASADWTGQLLLKIQEAELKIKAPSKVRYGRDAAFRVHLGSYASTSNPTVSVYKIVGGKKTLLKSQDVDVNGNVSGKLNNLTRNTWIQAEWGGDARSAPVTTKRLVGVAVIVKGVLVGYSATSGRYRLYGSGDVPTYAAHVTPSHAGKPITFVLQRENASGWKTIDNLTLKLDSKSNAVVVIKLAVGERYRVHAIFPADTDHVSGKSPYAYLRLA